MTHSLHREGSLEDLKKEFVVLANIAVGFNEEYMKLRLKEYFRIIAKYNPVNMGSQYIGHLYRDKTSHTSCAEDIIEKVTGKFNTHNAVFTDTETLGKVLKELKEADLGLSITISGVLDEVKKACEYAGIKPHTVNYSFGVYGNTTRLAKPKVREITTMCGHGMISDKLVEKLVGDIKKGKTTPRKAAEEICYTCYCGLVNVDRAEKLLEKMSLH